MRGLIALVFMFLVVLFALCVTTMGNTIIEIDGEVVVMSTGPPTLGVLALGETSICDDRDRIEATKLTLFVGRVVAAENRYESDTHNKRSGLLLWSNCTKGNGAPLHRWIQC